MGYGKYTCDAVQTETTEVVYTVLVKKNKIVDFFNFDTQTRALTFAQIVAQAAGVTNIEVTKVSTQKVVERIG